MRTEQPAEAISGAAHAPPMVGDYDPVMHPITLDSLADFPLAKYHIAVYCECGHTGIINDGVLPASTPLTDLEQRLRCSVCGARGPRVIIAYLGGIGNAAQHHGVSPVW
jgi:hypothetical protein